jgi:endonuclease YncB( thermonuclease family)
MGCSNSKYIDILNIELEKATYDSCSEFNLNDKIMRCKVIKVYDGDTIHIGFDENNIIKKNECSNNNIQIVRTKIRLYGIDCAEMRTKDEVEKKMAIKAKNRMEELVLNKIIYVHIVASDKYANRYIGKLYYDLNDVRNNITINNILLKENLAYVYDGKKKKDFDEWHYK